MLIMDKFTNVNCYYTGGGVWVYSARYNNEVWLYGSLDWYFGSYSIKGEDIEEKHANDYDTYWMNPSIPFPTWNEILDSLKTAPDHDAFFHEWEHIIRYANPEVEDMRKPCIILEDDSPLKDAPTAKPTDEKTQTYAVGNGEITLTESDAEELRIMLQTEHLRQVIDEIVGNNIDCFDFKTPSARKHFVDELVRMNDDCVNYDSSYYTEMLEENIFNRAEELKIAR